MFAALTSVNELHHQATGFDQARVFELAGHLEPRHSRFMNHSTRNGTDI
jgi:hypothetical protein